MKCVAFDRAVGPNNISRAPDYPKNIWENNQLHPEGVRSDLKKRQTARRKTLIKILKAAGQSPQVGEEIGRNRGRHASADAQRFSPRCFPASIGPISPRDSIVPQSGAKRKSLFARLLWKIPRAILKFGFELVRGLSRLMCRWSHILNSARRSTKHLGSGDHLPNSIVQTPGEVRVPSLATSTQFESYQENAESRVPCVILVDVSGSMAGPSIEELNGGLHEFAEAVRRDQLLALRVEIAIVACTTEPYVAQEFVPAGQFEAPKFAAGGITPLAEAGELAFDLLAARLALYETCDLDNFKPFVLIVTDGCPTSRPDAMARFSERVRRLESSKQAAVFFVGTSGANFECLKKIAVRKPLKLKGIQFTLLFSWVQESLRAISQSMPGTNPRLPDPIAAGWATL